MALFLVSVLNAILALVILSRNFRSQVNVYFSLYIFGIVFWALGLGMYYITSSYEGTLFWVQVYYNAANVIGFAFLMFAMAFPKGKLSMQHMLYVVLPTATLFTLIFAQPSFMYQDIVISADYKEVIFNPVGYAFYSLYFLVYYGLGFYLLIKKYKNMYGVYKIQLAYILIGNVIGGIFGVVFNLILPWFGNYQLIWVGPQFTIINVLIMSYAMYKHRLFDVQYVISKIAYFAMLAFIPYATFYIAFYIQTNLWGSIFAPQAFVFGYAIALFFLFILLFLNTSFRNLISILLSRRIDHYLFAKQQFTNKVNTMLDSNKICELLLETLYSTVRVDGLFLCLDMLHVHHQKRLCFYKGKLKQTFSDTDLNQLNQLITQSGNRISMIRDELTNGFRNVEEWNKDRKAKVGSILQQKEIALVVPMDKLFEAGGFLVMGDKTDRFAYTVQDVHYIESLVNHASLALQRASLYEETTNFNATLQKKIDKATKDLQSAFNELEDSYDKLKQLDEMKDDFLSITSHDLRTPLSIIKNYMYLILKTKSHTITDPKVLEQMHIIQESTDRMIRMVNNTLTVSRIQGGKLHLTPSKEDISALVEKIVSHFQQLASNKNITLELENVSQSVYAEVDKDRIEEVIVNLISNAINYTPYNGTVTVRACVKGNFIELSVTDTGVGIKKEDQDKLFKKFSRIEENSKIYTTEATGTGLGLYISKYIVELHNGSIGLNSEYEKGTTFWITLPIIP